MGTARGRQRRRRRDRGRARLGRRREPADRTRRRRVHARPHARRRTRRCSTSSSPPAGSAASPRGAELEPVDDRLRRHDPGLQRRAGLLRGPGRAERARRRRRAVRLDAARRPRRPGRRGSPATGSRSPRSTPTCSRSSRRSSPASRPVPRSTRPAGRMLGRGERIVFAELAETLERLRRRRPGALLPRRHRGRDRRHRPRRAAGPLSAADLESYETAVREPGPRPLRRLRDPHQPAALLGRRS